MTETYYAGVYWPGRSEPVEHSARQAERLFERLASVDPSLASWFEQGPSRAAALNSQFTPDARSLLRLFAKRKYQIGEAEIAFAAWNGRVDDSSVINFSCGSPVDLCVWTPSSRKLLAVRSASQVMHAMVLAWDPEWGVLTSDEHRDAVSESGDPGTFIGWMTYFSRHRGPVPPLPAPVQVEPVEDKGALVILTPEPFMRARSEHVELAEQVREQLDQAGLLTPLGDTP